MSNFTDFNVLSAEEDVALQYVETPDHLTDADIVILPGSKNTLADLSYLQEKQFASALDRHLCRQRELIGICGGYQMIGQRIADPYGVEQGGASRGLGYLDIETELTKTKRTTHVVANPMDALVHHHSAVRGYHIHMGVTYRGKERPCFTIRPNTTPVEEASSLEDGLDGAIRADGLVWGTYIHGVFDEPEFRRAWLNRARARKGLPPLEIHASHAITSRLHSELDRWADHLSYPRSILPPPIRQPFQEFRTLVPKTDSHARVDIHFFLGGCQYLPFSCQPSTSRYTA
ncbi:MAG: hypothetical protein QM706_06840 [Nitrospira sp.]